MSARVATRLAAGLGFLAVLAQAPGRADETGFAVPPPPDAPAFVELDAAAGGPAIPDPERTSALADGISVPEPPAVVVEVPPAEASRTAASPEAPTIAPPVLAAADVLAAAIQAKLADPRSPLPPRLSRRDRDALAAFYAANGHRPLWIAGGGWTEPARSVAAQLGRAGEDGLDPADYPVPNLATAAATPGPEDLAEAELKLSAAAFLYARDARGGRLDPARLGGLVTPKLALPSPEAVLSGLSGASDPARALAAYNPAYPGYAALRAKLAELRDGRPSGPMARASGPASQRLASVGGLPLGRAVSPRLEGDLVANMERWRWLPPEVPARYILVNVPEFRLRLVENGAVAHEARVITGRPATPTPIFSGTVDYAIVNPSWFIPPSILKKEILPGLAADPDYAARRGYSVVRRGKSVSVRQPPGPKNALGYVKFMFPNDHAVYLHDTPNRSLFGASQRALSHGCVRVEDPFALGGKIVGPAWSESRLKGLIGYGERQINLAEKLPISLAYFTVSIDAFGEMRMFDDVYGHNRRVRAALGLGG